MIGKVKNTRKRIVLPEASNYDLFFTTSEEEDNEGEPEEGINDGGPEATSGAVSSISGCSLQQ